MRRGEGTLPTSQLGQADTIGPGRVLWGGACIGMDSPIAH